MKYKSKGNEPIANHPFIKDYSRVLLFAVVAHLIMQPVSAQDLTISISSSTINALSNYDFNVVGLLNAIDAGSTLAITFPSGYSPTQLQHDAPYTGTGTICHLFVFSCSITVSFRPRRSASSSVSNAIKPFV